MLWHTMGPYDHTNLFTSGQPSVFISMGVDGHGSSWVMGVHGYKSHSVGVHCNGCQCNV